MHTPDTMLKAAIRIGRQFQADGRMGVIEMEHDEGPFAAKFYMSARKVQIFTWMALKGCYELSRTGKF